MLATAHIWRLLKPQSVAVNFNRINEIAAELATRNLAIPDWQISGILPTSHKAFASHAFYLCAINFCFTNPDGARFALDKKTIGSSAAAACFYRRFGEQPIKAEEMLDIVYSEEASVEFFRSAVPMPLMDERRQHLKEVAEILLKKFDDDPVKILYRDFFDAGKVVKTLCREFPMVFGSDRHIYEMDGGRWITLRFDKRARLWPLIYQGRALHSDEQLPSLRNIQKIGPVSDCAVPNILRFWNILDYTLNLSFKIEHGIELPTGSQQELEIRWATIYAVELLLEAINKIKPVTLVELDHYLWSMGKLSPFPYHYTNTTAY